MHAAILLFYMLICIRVALSRRRLEKQWRDQSSVELNQAQQLVLQAQAEIEKAIRVGEFAAHGSLKGVSRPPTGDAAASAEGAAGAASADATNAAAGKSGGGAGGGARSTPMIEALKLARRNLAHAVRLTFRVVRGRFDRSIYTSIKKKCHFLMAI